jgi:hypothetical protein
MKKSVLIMLAVIFFVAMTAPAVFAGSGDTFFGGDGKTPNSAHSTVLGSVVFTPSTNVSVNAMSTTGTGSPPNQYCVTSWHASSVNQSSGLQYAALSGGSASNPNTAIVTKTLGGVTTPPPCTQVDAWPSGF